MIITIDTSKDSHQDLRKLIKFLQHHVGETNYENNSLANDVPTPSAGMFDMFGNGTTPSTDNTLSDVSSLLENNEPEEEPEEKISIMPY
jgi:hypothetical protein